MSQVKLVRQHQPFSPRPYTQPISPTPKARTFAALGIVASTGGPAAVVHLLNKLPPQFPLPIYLVQHITAEFLPGFVHWLTGACPFEVRIASHGEKSKPSIIYMAPPNHHLECHGHTLHNTCGHLVCAQRPSGTVLFQSMAQSLKEKALGVLLTGMGEDGAEGLLKIKQAGGFTLAQDETTSVVYGMPAAAVARNAVCELLPLHNIAPRIQTLIT